MRPTYPSVHIEPIQMHKFPLFWKVIGINWEGEDFGLGILSRLNSDVSLAQSIIASSNFFDTNGLKIRAYPKQGCYILSVPMSSAPFTERMVPVPSNRLWNCYQTIAGHLLM